MVEFSGLKNVFNTFKGEKNFFQEIANEKMSEIHNLSKQTDFDNLIYYFKYKSGPKAFYQF